MDAPIDECGINKHYPLEMFRNGISKKTRSYYIGMMENGIPSLSSDSAMTSREKKNFRATFKTQIKVHYLSLYAEDDALFKNRSQKPSFALRPLKSMLNFEVDRLSLQQIEYEMDCADLPDY